MEEFNFFFGFFGLLLGLTVVEVATKFADAVDVHKQRPIDRLTALLAIFVIMDVTSFWLWTWSIRELIGITWRSVLGALAVSLSYYMSAALVFPRTTDWPSLEEHYWARKRMVLGGITFANASIYLVQLARLLPSWDDRWFFVWFVAYWGPLVALWIARSRRANILLLALLIGQYLIFLLPVPGSEWANAVGLNADPASTSDAAVTK